ncbi:hypothetical protein BC936DRAFT_143338 [Jimgerdemannia flammicorona]|uniref:C2H2-type domain-containing protein n=1 Tax=Jimgerdemannia flammicorona TaxID=994334 RepID=A0A432ZZ84_9FUNG|nr:hypothetical protein BC936DRAFT_143338 [Jimgerdemannia flammicorona]
MELDPPPLQHHQQPANNNRIAALNHLPIKKVRPAVSSSNGPTVAPPRPKGEPHLDSHAVASVKIRRTSTSANSNVAVSPGSSPVVATREPAGAADHSSHADITASRDNPHSAAAATHSAESASSSSSGATLASASQALSRVVTADDLTSEEQISQCVGYTASSQDTTIIACTMNGCQKYFANIEKFGAHRRSEHSTSDVETEVWIFGNPAGAKASSRASNTASSPTAIKDTGQSKTRVRTKTQPEIVPIDDLISAVTNNNSSNKRHLDANQDESHNNSATTKRPRDLSAASDESQRRGAANSDRRGGNDIRETQISGGAGVANGNPRPQQHQHQHQQQHQQQRAGMMRYDEMMDGQERRDRYMMMQQPLYTGVGGRRPGGGMDPGYPMPSNLSVERSFNDLDPGAAYYNALQQQQQQQQQQRMTTQRGFSPPPPPTPTPSRNFMSPNNVTGNGPPAPGGGGYSNNPFEPMDVGPHGFGMGYGEMGGGVPGGGYPTFDGQYYDDRYGAGMGPAQAPGMGNGRRFGPGGGSNVGDGGKGTGPNEMVAARFVAMQQQQQQQFLPPAQPPARPR